MHNVCVYHQENSFFWSFLTYSDLVLHCICFDPGPTSCFYAFIVTVISWSSSVIAPHGLDLFSPAINHLIGSTCADPLLFKPPSGPVPLPDCRVVSFISLQLSHYPPAMFAPSRAWLFLDQDLPFAFPFFESFCLHLSTDFQLLLLRFNNLFLLTLLGSCFGCYLVFCSGLFPSLWTF